MKKVKARRAHDKKRRDQERAERVRKRAKELVAQHVYPSDRQMRKDSRVKASDLRLPQIKIVLREIQNEFLITDTVAQKDTVLANRIRASQRIVPSPEVVQVFTQTYNPDNRKL